MYNVCIDGINKMADLTVVLFLVTGLALIAQVSGFLLNPNSKGNYSCTVEQDSCNYTIQNSRASPQLQWTRTALSYVSQPHNDHTLNVRGRGHVFTVKAVSGIQIHDNTSLHSPVMTDLYGNTYVGFWYSISASGTSSMNFTVYHRAYATARKIPLFNRLVHGVVGWTHVCVTIPVYLSLELIFEVVAIRNYVTGEISIDDITVQHGNNCSSTTLPTSGSHVMTTPYNIITTHVSGTSVTCDFEDPSICGYKNVTSPRDNFDWTRNKGETRSVNTGPSGDHTTQSGYYMYIEATGKTPGDKALLESPSFITNEAQYLEFWYHGYGNTLGSLSVYVEHYGTYLGRPVFTASNVSTTVWHHGCFNIPITHQTSHIVFEGIVGSSYRGDYAIDDVTLGKGSCTSPLKPVDGGWSSWGAYTSCSTTCGIGSRRSTRTCTNPTPRYEGHTCSGSSYRTLTCRQVECPIDGDWGSWSAWSYCPVTCGIGTRISTRQCDNPPPNNNGKDCVGASSKNSTCQNFPCTVDGGWSDWTLWTQCSTSCALGTMTRDRSCSNPVPAGGGKLCTGDHMETHECSLGPCPSWSHWYQGDCSSTCGNGTAERMRSCSTGNNADCAGISYEHVPCIGTECIRK